MGLQYVGHLGLGDPLLDQDLRDLDMAWLPAGPYLVADTGASGGLISYRLAEGAAAGLADSAHFTGSATTAQAGLARSVGGAVVFGTVSDGGGKVILAQALTADGGFGGMVALGELPQDTSLVTALVSARMDGFEMLFAADGGSGQILVFRNDEAPRSPADAPPAPVEAVALEGSALLSIAETGARPHLLALERGRGALHGFVMDPASGALSAGAVLDGDAGLAIADATALETLSAHGTTWAIIAAAGTHSLSVVRIADDGALALTDHVLDTLATRFGGVHGLGVAQVGDHVFIVAGGADDGLSLFRLLPDGRLLHVETIANGAGLGLGNVGQVSATVLGAELQLFVAGDPRGGLSQFGLDLSGLGVVAETAGNAAALLAGTPGDDLLSARGFGNDTLSGGAGDDILVAGPGESELRGGDGADTFVLSADSGRVRITDFDPAHDRLDLSALPMLRNPGQLGLETAVGSARLAFRDTSIEITVTGPVLLDAACLFGPVFAWPDRLPILATGLPPPITGGPGADPLDGTSGPEVIDGQGGSDTLFGLAGNDSLRGAEGPDLLGGGPGDDLVTGGADNDTVFGGADNDTLEGDEGDDELGGSLGHDSLIGGPGQDRMFGADGRDTLLGGDGRDMLGGGPGDDLLFGGIEADALWGTDGNDSLWGEAGRDTLGGSTGHDEIHGGADDDEIWGGDGNDSVDGDGGNDTIGLFLGDDSAAGGSGDDELWGAAGNDTLLGGDGADTLGGGGGSDLLDGGAGPDTLWGGSEADSLLGGAGNDLLNGGSGADSFVFIAGHGRDTIGDFDPLDPLERIDLSGIGTLGSLADVLAVATALGPDLLIDTGGGDSILLRNIAANDLDADDFLF